MITLGSRGWKSASRKDFLDKNIIASKMGHNPCIYLKTLDERPLYYILMDHIHCIRFSYYPKH